MTGGGSSIPEVQRLLAGLDADGVEIRSVMHTAGTGILTRLEDTTVTDLADATAAKVAGARHLDELLDSTRLDALVHFSSIAGVWGVGRHGAYAAGTEFQIGRIAMVGNTGTYLDTPAHRYRDGHDLAALPLERCAGLPALVVRAAGAGQVVQKVCSTFDSTPEGNIGPVALALLNALGAPGAANSSQDFERSLDTSKFDLRSTASACGLTSPLG